MEGYADWDSEGAGHSRRSEAVGTWGYSWVGCLCGSCWAAGDYCRIGLVVLAHSGALEAEACFGRQMEECCRYTVGGWRLPPGEIGAPRLFLVDGRVLVFGAVAATKSTEQPKR